MANKSKDTVNVNEEVPIDIDISNQKSLREHMETGVKYSTPSVGAGYLLARMVVFFYPEVEPIQLEIGGVLTVLGNLLMILIFKSGTHPKV